MDISSTFYVNLVFAIQREKKKFIFAGMTEV